MGWPDWELFGCHRRAPWGRIQGMGLVLLLRGDEIAALTASEAVIRTADRRPPDLPPQAVRSAPPRRALPGVGALVMAAVPTLERTTFRTSRLLEFCSRKELVAQTGHEPDAWPLVVLKELVDNALDACEEAGVAPEIGCRSSLARSR